jgi:hypothetical protein
MLILQPDALIIRDELDLWMERPYDYIGSPWPTPMTLSINTRPFSDELARTVSTAAILDTPVYGDTSFLSLFPAKEQRVFLSKSIGPDRSFAGCVVDLPSPIFGIYQNAVPFSERVH